MAPALSFCTNSYKRPRPQSEATSLCWVPRPQSTTYFEIKGVIGVRHQVVFVGALKLEAVRYPPFGSPVFPVAAEIHQTLVVSQLLEVLVVVSDYSVA